MKRLTVCAALAFSLLPSGARADANQEPLPKCYQEVLKRSVRADDIRAGKTMCLDIYGPKKTLVLLSATTKMCEEWWLDTRGRYESSQMYCDFSRLPGKEPRWQLACQYKDNHRRIALQTLSEKKGAYEVVESKGESPGRLFANLAACVRTKVR